MCQRFQDELERYQNFFDLGERDVMLEEIQDLKTQLQFYNNSSPKKTNVLQIIYTPESADHRFEAESKWVTLLQESQYLIETERKCAKELKDAMQMAMEGHAKMLFDLWERDVLLEEIQDLKCSTTISYRSFIQKTNVLQITYPPDSADHRFEAESKWVTLLQESRYLIEKQKHELETERKCAKELKDVMKMAMEGHEKMLEQYADLEEKHITLLTTQRRIENRIIDVKKDSWC